MMASLLQTNQSPQSQGLLLAALAIAGVMFVMAIYLLYSIRKLNNQVTEQKKPHKKECFHNYINLLNSEQIKKILRIKQLGKQSQESRTG